eukprot:SAG11_NODE_21218_length_429_cov_1.327273_1_plen_27_part_10
MGAVGQAAWTHGSGSPLAPSRSAPMIC